RLSRVSGSIRSLLNGFCETLVYVWVRGTKGNRRDDAARLMGEKKMRLRSLIGAVVALAGMLGTCRADSVDAKFLNVTNGGIILSVSAPGLSTVAGYVGQYIWVTLGNSGLGPIGTSFYTFCIELNQDINFNTSYHYDLIDASGAPRPGAPVP